MKRVVQCTIMGKMDVITCTFILTLVCHISDGVHGRVCDAGTYQSEDGTNCLPCPPETYMSLKNHTIKSCFDCTKIEDSTLEILIKPCDRFHDANIQCQNDYFRHQAKDPHDIAHCKKCLPFCPKHFTQVFPCQNFSQLGCCPGENYDYGVGKNNISVCRERPWMCRRGQFWDTQENDCKPCPEDTFMHEDYHSHTKCWDCQYESEADLPLHAVLSQPCARTQPSRYECEEGYYVDERMSYRGDDIGCSPCQTCDEGKYVGRQCDMYHDTVCCDRPNMTVEDGRGGTLCVDSCKYGTYNPPDCDKSCNQHCRESERSDASPCDHYNGTCLYGCDYGYTGTRCETQHDDGNRKDVGGGVDVSTIVMWVSLVGLIVETMVIFCFICKKRCPGSVTKWWQTLVDFISSQNTRGVREDADNADSIDMEEGLLNGTQTRIQELEPEQTRLTNEITRTNREMEAVGIENGTLQIRIRELETEITTKNRQVESVESENGTLQIRIQVLETEQTRLTNEINKKNRELETVRNQNAKLIMELRNLKERPDETAHHSGEQNRTATNQSYLHRDGVIEHRFNRNEIPTGQSQNLPQVFLRPYLSYLKGKNPNEQATVADKLREMASTESTRQKVQQFPGLVRALEDLKESEDETVRRKVRLALQVIEGTTPATDFDENEHFPASVANVGNTDASVTDQVPTPATDERSHATDLE